MPGDFFFFAHARACGAINHHTTTITVTLDPPSSIPSSIPLPPSPSTSSSTSFSTSFPLRCSTFQLHVVKVVKPLHSKSLHPTPPPTHPTHLHTRCLGWAKEAARWSALFLLSKKAISPPRCTDPSAKHHPPLLIPSGKPGGTNVPATNTPPPPPPPLCPTTTTTTTTTTTMMMTTTRTHTLGGCALCDPTHGEAWHVLSPSTLHHPNPLVLPAATSALPPALPLPTPRPTMPLPSADVLVLPSPPLPPPPRSLAPTLALTPTLTLTLITLGLGLGRPPLCLPTGQTGDGGFLLSTRR